MESYIIRTQRKFTTEAGKGAYKNENQIHVSCVKELSHSLISVGTSPYYHENATQNFAAMEKVFTV